MEIRDNFDVKVHFFASVKVNCFSYRLKTSTTMRTQKVLQIQRSRHESKLQVSSFDLLVKNGSVSSAGCISTNVFLNMHFWAAVVFVENESVKYCIVIML